MGAQPVRPVAAGEGRVQSLKRSFGTGQRVRAGLTGLAAIFLIVMAAAAGLRPQDEAPVEAYGEPLAVLGVAPGSGSDATLRRQTRDAQAAKSQRPPARI